MMDYAVLMMAISDNTAADYLYQLVGPKAIHEHIFQPLGMANSLCNTEGRSLLNAYYGVTVEEYRRKDAAGERFHARNGSYFRCEEPKNKQTTPRDMIKLLRALYGGTFTDPETDQRILDVMHKCQSKLLMPAKLPAGVRSLATLLLRIMSNGRLDPFFRKIVAQDGTVKNDGSQALTPDELLHMDWLCSNVDGTIPPYEALSEKAKKIVELQGVYRDHIPPKKEGIIL